MDDKINDTKEMPKAGPLASTLAAMDQWNMNTLDEPKAGKK